MNPHQLLDPAYRAFLDEPDSLWTHDTLPAIRARIDASFKPIEGARSEQRWTPNACGSAPMRLCLHWPQTQARDGLLPAILYIHGGGFVLGCPEMVDDYLTGLATQVGALIVAVDYRLAPEFPFPVPLEDCHAALAWIFDQQQALGIDTRRVLVMGHSAGGGLAAALTIMARDLAAPGSVSGSAHWPLAGQVLIYPMLDHRTGTADAPARNPSTGTFSWQPAPNRFCWECLRGTYDLQDRRAGWFSPSLAHDLSSLPAAVIAVGALDLFLDENLAYTQALSHAGVAVEMHLYPGAPHMFDQLPGPITDQCLRDVTQGVKRLLLAAADAAQQAPAQG